MYTRLIMGKTDVDTVLTRGVGEILPDNKGLALLMKKGKIRLYLGIDATAPKLHLGHTVGLRKLQQFANLGHEAILLFGTGTVLAGDPSQRKLARKKIDPEQISNNISTWKEQVEPIIDFTKIKIMFNGDWLLKLSLGEILDIASNISAVQLFKREMFQNRINRKDTIWTHEVLYPLLQGYDSVALDVDLEIGGTDQTFNMLIGRELQRKMNQREKYVLTFPMIMGTDGEQMSKTSGNCVWLKDSPSDMYGKLMGTLDEQIIPYMELASNIPSARIKEINSLLAGKDYNPMDAKKELAFAVVSEFHSKKKAISAQNGFEKTFQERKPEYKTFKTESNQLVGVIEKYSKSRSDAKRKIKQGGIDINGKTITDPTTKVSAGDKIKIGSRVFIKIK